MKRTLLAGKRHLAREMAVQMLYQSDLGGSPLLQVFHNFDLHPFLPALRPAKKARDEQSAISAKQTQKVEEAFDYARDLVRGTLEHQSEIDTLIREQADHWRLERMPAVDRNILRLAVYEILYEQDIPKLVVVDEAIELAKKYGAENSGRFINGLLDGLLKQHSFPGSLT